MNATSRKKREKSWTCSWRKSTPFISQATDDGSIQKQSKRETTATPWPCFYALGWRRSGDGAFLWKTKDTTEAWKWQLWGLKIDSLKNEALLLLEVWTTWPRKKGTAFVYFRKMNLFLTRADAAHILESICAFLLSVCAAAHNTSISSSSQRVDMRAWPCDHW